MHWSQATFHNPTRDTDPTLLSQRSYILQSIGGEKGMSQGNLVVKEFTSPLTGHAKVSL